MLKHGSILTFATIMVMLVSLVACNGTGEETLTVTITGPGTPPYTTAPGGRIPLGVNASGGGGDFKFEWTAAGASVQPGDKPSVEFIAPNSPGDFNVSVKVKSRNSEATKSAPIKVIAPATPTATLTPTLTPTIPPAPTKTDPAPTPSPTATREPTNTSTPSPTPTRTPTPSPTLTKTPVPRVIASTETTSVWALSGDTIGSTHNIRLVPGRTGNAIGLHYNVKPWGYVTITASIDPKLLDGTRGVSFFYKGIGEPNTIELKFLLRYPGDTDDTTYLTVWNNTTNAGDTWEQLTAIYADVQCGWPAAYCNLHPTMDLTRVLRMDLVVSNKPDKGGVPGEGDIAFDDIWAIQP